MHLLQSVPRPGAQLAQRIAVIGGSALALALVIAGWREFELLLDDAYIGFRYVSNSQAGFGYVWNPPPFRPVEGYSSLLWLLVLDGVWRLGGGAPPEVANVLSLAFSLVTLGLTWLALWSLPLPPRLAPHRGTLLVLGLLGVATNRTFLTWTGSGLETALFNCLVMAWTCTLLFGSLARVRWTFAVTALAALLHLARPDGLLFSAASAALVVGSIIAAPERRAERAAACGPLLAVPLHLAWRRAWYGDWLPNTYYAKVNEAWPESGLRYLLSFVLEHGLWLWAAVAGWALTRWLIEVSRAGGGDLMPRVARCTPAAVLTCQLGYYVLIVGGDHFEYRIFSHLVPLLFVSLVWSVARLELSVRPALGVVAGAVAVALPIPWVHWSATHELGLTGPPTRLESLFVPIEGRAPALLRPYARAFDEQQAWLVRHFVGVRFQEHKANTRFLRYLFPARANVPAPDDDTPVFVFPAVGYAAWVLPNVALIDTHGLNDYVIARTPPPPTAQRMMAHEHVAPADYLRCFRPNVRLEAPGYAAIVPRAVPLSPSEVHRCEDWLSQ